MKQVDGSLLILMMEMWFFLMRAASSKKRILLEDTYYNVISVHVFPMIPNQDWTHLYPA